MALNRYLIEFEFSPATWTAERAEIDTGALVKNEVLHNGLRPADSSVSLRIPNPSVELINALYAIGSASVAVRIHKNDADYFYGYLRNTFTLEKGQRIQPIALEIVSPSNLLKRKIKTGLSYVGHTVAALLDHLLTAAGLSGYSLPTLTTVLPAFAVEPNTTTWHDVVSQLLFEYGYTFTFDAAGVMIFHSLFPATFDPSTRLFNGANCLGKIIQEKQEQSRDTVETKWTSIKTASDCLVFSDTSNAAILKKCNIGILPGEYLQGESSGFYATLSHPDGELLYTADQTLELTKEAAIVLDAFTPGNLRSLIRIHNGDGTFERFITKLDIRAGTAIIKTGENTSTATSDGDSEKIETVKSSYIFDKTSAGNLSANLLGYFKYADFSYRLTSRTDYAIGAIVTISEDYLGEIVARIVGKKANEATNSELVVYEYALEGVGEWTPETAAHVIIQAHPAPAELPAAIADAIEDVPTYVEIVDGFTAGGGTTTPATVGTGEWSAAGASMSVAVSVDKQGSLTNFLRNEIQVKDGASWYAPVHTGSPWHDPTADTYAAFPAGGSLYIHEQLPLTVDGDGIATAKAYEYRVRRVPKSGSPGAWSASKTASAQPIGAGALAANSIVAGAIAAEVLNALIANISDELTVSSTLGWQAGGTGTPSLYDLRTFQDGTGFYIQYWTGSGWSTISGFYCWHESPSTMTGKIWNRGTHEIFNAIDEPAISAYSGSVICPNLNADMVDDHHVSSGEWSPVVSGATTQGSPTYTYQDGSYLKVGRFVSFRLHVKLSNLGGCVGIIRISLPFTNISGADKYGACAIGYITGTSPSTGYTYHAVTIPNTNYIYFFVYTQSSGNAAGPLGEGSFTNSMEVILSGFFEASE